MYGLTAEGDAEKLFLMLICSLKNGDHEMKKPRPIICKPCWELKYCPYGVLVEYFPLFPEANEIEDIKAKYQQLILDFERGEFKTEQEILAATRVLLFLRPYFWEKLQEYDNPEIQCNVYGHTCPAFFVAEPFTETKQMRRQGRYIPREIMLKVVRRDGQICQLCHKLVPDNEMHFDHVIPVSKGGPTSVANLRVVCSDCNQKKSDSVDELLDERYKQTIRYE